MSAARRITKSSIDWKRFKQLLPEREVQNFNNFYAKNSQYITKISTLSEDLPKIDFAAYKNQLGNKAASIEKLEKGYTSYQIPYPKDADNLLGKIDAEEKTFEGRINEFFKSLDLKAKELLVEKQKAESLPPLEEMTLELKAYYYPESIKEIQIDDGEHDKLFAKAQKAKKLGAGAHH